MARELDININLVDGGAKQTAQEVDQALDQTAASADKAGQSIALLEGKLALAKAQLANTNTEMRMLTAAMADMSGGAQAKLQGELQLTGERFVQARTNVAAATDAIKAHKAQIESNLDNMKQFGVQTVSAADAAKVLGTNTEETTGSMSNMDRMAERLVMRMALLQGLRMAFQFTEGLFTAAEATANLATNLDTTTTKVQEWEFASKQSGVSMGVMAGAADTLGKKIAGGGDSVTAALQTLGLDTDQYFNAEPGERFDQTAAAIAEMGDKTARTGVEMALFGTDKVDPLILRLKELEKAAHDAGVVLDEEDTKTLNQAAKSLETTSTWLKVVAAGWLVAAQNAVAYYAAAMGRIPTEGGDVQPLVTAPGAPKNPFVTGGMGGPGASNPLDPSKKAGLAEIDGIQKQLNADTENQIAIENKQLAFEKSAFAEREQLYKKIQAEMLKTSEMYLKVTNDAVVAELAAKERVNAAQGLDIHGNPTALGQTAQAIAAKEQHDLDVSAATSPGVSTAARQQEINDKFLKSIMNDAQAADTEEKARVGATDSAVKLSAAHVGAVAALDATSSALASFRGVVAGAVDALSSAANMSRNAPLAVNNVGVYNGDGVGQFGAGASAGMAMPMITAAGRDAGLGFPHFADGGYAPNAMHAVVGDSPGGEYMVPAQKMDKLMSGGGVSIGDIHIHGDVNSRATADRVAQQTADLVFAQMKGQRKVRLGKA